MRKNYIQKMICIIVLCISSSNALAQVGIGTTTPDASAELDITSANRGLLMPRVALTSTADTGTIAGAEATSLLVYNTATAGDVTPGFYYWNGTQWTRLNTNAWTTSGNAGTNDATNFLGTTDAQDLAIRTNNTEVFRITEIDGDNDPKIIAGNAGNNGDEQDPLYTFSGDDNTGIWSDGADEFSLGGGGQEFITIDEGPDEVIINEDGDNIDFRIESSGFDDLFMTDGANDRIGMFTNTPATDINIAGTNTEIRIDAFNSVNNVNNNGIDPASVYVDANGNLTLAGPLTDSSMPEDNATTFVPATVNIDTPNNGAFTSATLYTTSITLTQNSLVEIVYQVGVNMEERNGTGPIDDGEPRQYGTALIIGGNIVGYSSECYTSAGSGTIMSGTFFLNGNGYIQLAPGTYPVDLLGFVAGGDDPCRGAFGGNAGLDRFQIIVHN